MISANHKKRIAIFASGAGSNTQQIIHHFKKHELAGVVLIVCNNSLAGVLEISKKENIPAMIISKKEFNESGYVNALRVNKIDLIVLAGFLWKVPTVLINAFPERIINIHPALLPAYGGKGMYGGAVHRAVIAAKEKQSGITIHFVDEQYDHGKIVLQEKINLSESETEESLGKKIHVLEHKYFASAIEKLLG